MDWTPPSKKPWGDFTRGSPPTLKLSRVQKRALKQTSMGGGGKGKGDKGKGKGDKGKGKGKGGGKSKGSGSKGWPKSWATHTPKGAKFCQSYLLHNSCRFGKTCRDSHSCPVMDARGWVCNRGDHHPNQCPLLSK